jgi:HlyD family secretion protein
MNRRRVIVIVAAGVAVLLVAAAVYLAVSARARASLLSRLDAGSGEVLGSLTASGFIEADEVRIAAELGGRVVELPFEEGDEVSSGDTLVRLDTALLEAQRRAAQAKLDIALAQRELVQAGPRPELIRQAEAQVAAAQAAADAARVAYESAVAVRNNPQSVQVQVVEAETQLSVAQEQVNAAQIQLEAADRLQQIYTSTADHLNELEGRYGTTFGLYIPPELGLAPQRYQEALINLNSAQATLNGAQELLASLQRLASNPQALQVQVATADAARRTAEAALERAQAQLADLQAGATPEQLAIADAQVQESQAAVDAIEAQISRMTITAPMDGVILEQSVHVSELAVPGVPLVTLANLDTLTLTVYVTAVQLSHVSLNQQVVITVDAFPDRTFDGVVTYISDQAEFTPRSVQTREERVNLVYAVRIQIANPDHLLKPGMPADALFD